MKTATVRDLRNEFPKVARWIEDGECVEVTRGGKPFARLSPLPPPTGASLVPMPDFLGRLQAYFPSEKVSTMEVGLVDWDRGDR